MKKPFIIIVIVAVLLLLSGILLFLRQTPPEQSGTDTPSGFNPFGLFGGDSGVDGAPDTTSPDEDTPFVSQDVPARVPFKKISEAPVAGSVFVQKGTGTSTENVLRYVERETGHVIDYAVALGTKNRVSNTTIPRVREVVWGNGGTSIALRYADDDVIKTFVGTLPSPDSSSSGAPSLSGSFLPDNVTTITLHPALEKIFYVVPTQTGSVGYLVDNASAGRVVFSHPFSEWSARWVSDSSVLLTTKPSYNVPGGVFVLNTENGTLQNLMLGVPSPITLADTNSPYVVYSQSGSAGLFMSLYDTISKESSPLAITTLPDKCAWSLNTTLYCGVSDYPSNTNLPDAWYQGSISFSDEVWGIDPALEMAAPLVRTTDFIPEGIDIVSLGVSSDESFLSLIDKKTGELWLADLSFTLNVQGFKSRY